MSGRMEVGRRVAIGKVWDAGKSISAVKANHRRTNETQRITAPCKTKHNTEVV